MKLFLSYIIGRYPCCQHYDENSTDGVPYPWRSPGHTFLRQFVEKRGDPRVNHRGGNLDISAGLSAPRPHVRLSTGRPVSQYAGKEGCAGLAGAEPHA
jgi:hypothetical protein